MKKILTAVLTISVLGIGLIAFYSMYVRRIKLSDVNPPIEKTREAQALSAFFGLDALPAQSLLLYWRGPGKNGMPLVLSQEVDPSTLDNTDFEVTTQNGVTFSVEFVTLKPANEEFELRTILFIGEYGAYPDNPPVRVTIVGDLMSRSGQNYKGQSLPVIPLPDGPTISYAEHFIIDDDYPYVKSGAGCDCPKEETEQVVRTVWAGGVRAANGKELGDNELNSFQITLVRGKDTTQVHPFKLADLGDGDNNIDLCLKEKGTPVLVEAEAGIAIDPRNDLNPKTKKEVVSRW
ncbi:hypothetical protein BST85_06350 [Aureitalea marina]|uniref:Uncharacterized protein n=1 Tax=Aureitalea marina TaxID=930804 RepID=A0A2S7KTL2_9FLAO|nr:hypothetical protein BST85_06350 [Aureitalea marina]